MTKHFIKADPVAWKQALSEYESAKELYEALELPTTPLEELANNAAMDKYFEAEETLLETPAPDLGAVIDKLMIMWADDICYDQTEPAQKRAILGDLRRVQILHGLV